MRKTKADKAEGRRTTAIICTAILIVFSVLLPVLLKSNTQVQYKSIYSGYTVGVIAEKNVYAKNSIDLVDHDATQKKVTEARASVLPVFSYSAIKSAEIISRADRLRSYVAASDSASLVSLLGDTSLAQSVMALDPSFLGIAYNIINDIVLKGYYVQSELDAVKTDGYSEMTISNVYDGISSEYEYTVPLDFQSIITATTVDGFISAQLTESADKFTAREIIVLEDLIDKLTEANVFYDSVLTMQRRNDAGDSVDPVVISVEKGQILIEADHVVNHEQMELLRLLSTQSNSLTFVEVLGHIVFDIVFMCVAYYVFTMFLGRNDFHFLQHNILLTAGFLISLVATFFLVLLSSRLNLEFSDSFLPVFFLPLFMTEITGYKRIGFVSSAMLSAVLATLPTASMMTFFYCFACGSVCVFLIRFFNKRMDMIYQWFFSCITCAGVTILFMLINQASFTMIFTVLLGTLMNVSIAYILLTALLPVAERVFNLPTIFRLYELAYGESPILTRLSQSAPGTYSHSMAVADLAEVGARAIGANALLARVGGLYHDIGKIEHPEYFIENQNGVNKHDDISPSLSVAVIKSHIKVGADKGREAGLPTEIIKIISSHHGNDIIAYFYNEAMKTQAASNDRGETVKASDYSYNAEIPDFKECGVVMLADSIEAASRTVTPNASKYAKLIDSIFIGKIERGQLDNSGLTMNDIKTLSEAFVKTLVARNHSRIEYPDGD